MTKHGHNTGSGRTGPTAASTRVDQQGDEARPFAEARRILDDVLHVLSLHKWAFFVPCCLITSIAFIVSLYYPRMYRATTMFERRTDPVLIDLPMSAGAASFDYFRSTMESDLTSLATMRDVVVNLGMTDDFRKEEDGSLTPASKRRRDSLARALGSHLSIGRRSPNRQMDIVGITYTGPDPNIGSKLVDEVKRVYIRRTMSWVREYLERQREYFQNEATEASEELKQAQRESTKLHLENPYANPDDPSALSTNLAQLEMERRGLKLRKREYEAELSSLRQMRAAMAPGTEMARSAKGGSDDLSSWKPISIRAQQLQTQMAKIDQEINELRSTRGMRDAHPIIQELLAKHLRLKQAFDAERDSTPAVDRRSAVVSNRSFDDTIRSNTYVAEASVALESTPFNGELARLNVQVESQKSKIDEVDFSLKSNEQALVQLRSAKKNLFENQEAFDKVQERVTKARQRYGQLESVLMSIQPAINAIEQDRLMQFSEGQPARGSSKPVSPKANVVVLLAILAGIAAGVGCVILAEMLDRIYRSSGQVARSLGLPILEAIDEIVTADDRRRSLIRRVVIAPVLIIGLTGIAGLTGSMAYLSIRRPSTYQKLKTVPRTAAKMLGVEVSTANAPTTEQGS